MLRRAGARGDLDGAGHFVCILFLFVSSSIDFAVVVELSQTPGKREKEGVMRLDSDLGCTRDYSGVVIVSE